MSNRLKLCLLLQDSMYNVVTVCEVRFTTNILLTNLDHIFQGIGVLLCGILRQFSQNLILKSVPSYFKIYPLIATWESENSYAWPNLNKSNLEEYWKKRQITRTNLYNFMRQLLRHTQSLYCQSFRSECSILTFCWIYTSCALASLEHIQPFKVFCLKKIIVSLSFVWIRSLHATSGKH